MYSQNSVNNNESILFNFVFPIMSIKDGSTSIRSIFYIVTNLKGELIFRFFDVVEFVLLRTHWEFGHIMRHVGIIFL